MDATETLKALRDRGVTVSVVDGRLACAVPIGQMTDDLRDSIRSNRDWIIVIVESETRMPVSLPWRPVVASWPESWRERWGKLANARHEAGEPFPDHEANAYEIVSAEYANSSRQQAA